MMWVCFFHQLLFSSHQVTKVSIARTRSLVPELLQFCGEFLHLTQEFRNPPAKNHDKTLQNRYPMSLTFGTKKSTGLLLLRSASFLQHHIFLPLLFLANLSVKEHPQYTKWKIPFLTLPKTPSPRKNEESPPASWRFNSSSLSWHFFQAFRNRKPSGLNLTLLERIGSQSLVLAFLALKLDIFFPRLLLPQSSLLPQLLDAHEVLKMKVCGPSYRSLSQPSNSPIWYGTMWNPFLSLPTNQLQ